MAEFVEKRCEDMIPELEQMERIKLFDKNEIRFVFEVIFVSFRILIPKLLHRYYQYRVQPFFQRNCEKA